jgi:hypothetical protein
MAFPWQPVAGNSEITEVLDRQVAKQADAGRDLRGGAWPPPNPFVGVALFAL